MKKIALVGKMRSGKDTVAELLKTIGYKEYKFSAGIRAVESMLTYKETDGKNRKLLQNLGQSMRELFGEDVWVEYTFNQIKEDNYTGNVVISDCRQANEARRLKEEGYVLVAVEAPEELRIQRMLDLGDNFSKEDMNHETENIDFDVDFVIKNDGTLTELENKVNVLLTILNNTKVFIDMDGVMVKWQAGSTKFLDKGYFIDPERVDEFVHLVKDIVQCYGAENVYILSKMFPNHKSIESEKRLWLIKYLPEIPFNNRLMCPHDEDKIEWVKTQVDTTNSINFLLDDYGVNLSQWIEESSGRFFGIEAVGPNKFINNLLVQADSTHHKWEYISYKTAKLADFNDKVMKIVDKYQCNL